MALLGGSSSYDSLPTLGRIWLVLSLQILILSAGDDCLASLLPDRCMEISLTFGALAESNQRMLFKRLQQDMSRVLSLMGERDRRQSQQPSMEQRCKRGSAGSVILGPIL